jgi:NADPH:quinone reductase-like Zn-dependent oxidoreductase
MSGRFDITGHERTMKAVVTTGNGDYDKLEYRDVPVPVPGAGEVLLKVLAAGVNNTEINTRLGWYSSDVTDDTASIASQSGRATPARIDGGWNAATPFPLIQGTDCCGRVVELGAGVTPELIGARVLVRACMRTQGFDDLDNVWMASDFDGAFAEYVKVPATEVFAITTCWSDAQLATIPCAYGTAENMLARAGVAAGMRVLVTGASGGVGSAAVQLARRRGARVSAVSSGTKLAGVKALGAAVVLDRATNLLEVLGESSFDVVVDNVAGAGFAILLKLLTRGGRYVSSGAIAGPLVTLDMRDMYLKDLSLIGCTAWDEAVFPDLIQYIESGELRPLLAGTYPLDEIARAQAEFMKKSHLGNLVLIPPGA